MSEPARNRDVVAAFADSQALLRAISATRDAGFDALDAYAPYAVEGLDEALGRRRRVIAPLALIGGAVSGIGIYMLQWYSAVIDYPIDSGGRPLDSWPAFVPPAFDFGVLGAVVAMLVGLLWLAGLPRLNHPLFDVPGFEHVTRDRYFLVVHAGRERRDCALAREVLDAEGAFQVSEIDA